MDSTNPIDALFSRAERHGVPMSQICERAGVAATTPSRWKQNRNGATLATVEKLTAALGEIISARAA